MLWPHISARFRHQSSSLLRRHQFTDATFSAHANFGRVHFKSTVFRHAPVSAKGFRFIADFFRLINRLRFGESALALSRDLGVQYKTAFVLAHKLREAMASELKGMRLGGDGETVEVDGGYFGGYIKPANHKENRRDRRLAKNQNGKRQVVVVIRERGGRTLPAVFKTEASSASFIAARVAKGTLVQADEAASWNVLPSRSR
jgi:hypothetical protein